MISVPGSRALAALALSLALPLTGCGNGGDDPGDPAGTGAGSPPGSSAPPASGAPSATGEPQGGQKIGGKSSGVTLTLPAGWKQVDPTTDGSEVVRTSFGLAGDTGPLVERLLAEQVKRGVIFAYDTSVSQGYAPHLQAGCDRGGITGSSLEQLKAKTRAINPDNLKITDLTVDGRPAFKATYTTAKRDPALTAEGALVRVPVPGDRFCFVEIEARQGTMPPTADQILQSLHLA